MSIAIVETNGEKSIHDNGLVLPEIGLEGMHSPWKYVRTLLDLNGVSTQDPEFSYELTIPGSFGTPLASIEGNRISPHRDESVSVNDLEYESLIQSKESHTVYRWKTPIVRVPVISVITHQYVVFGKYPSTEVTQGEKAITLRSRADEERFKPQFERIVDELTYLVNRKNGMLSR